MIKPRILVIDDDFGDAPLDRTQAAAMQAAFVREVDREGVCEFVFCSGQEEGRNSLQKVRTAVERGWPPTPARDWWSLILLDLAFYQEPRGSDDDHWGFVVLADLRERWPDLPVVMLTTEDAAKKKRANWAQADGFLPKPIEGDDNNQRAFLRRLYALGLFPDLRETPRLAGRSLAVLKVLQEARRFACDPLGSGRILYGETGTGKTELARFIHDQMSLLAGRTGPFVSWSAAGANEDITKAALFGHWEGAFNDARVSESGQIERAHGGTFFLDEVSSLTPGAQALFIESRRRDTKLRRLISRMGKFPEGEARRRGAERSVVPQPWRSHLQDDHRIAVDVVMLTASNVNLHDEEVTDALSFRRDLLNDLGTPICLPGLNDRREDIPEIFEQIVSQIVRQLGWPAKHIDSRVLSELQARDWTKRNVVALRQIGEHAVISARDFDEVLLRHLPPPFDPPNWPGSRPPMRKNSVGGEESKKTDIVKPPQTLGELSTLLKAYEVPTDPTQLDGSLPVIQSAYAELVLKLFGAALRTTRDRRGETSSLRAVCKLLGVKELRSAPQSYAAYDVVLRMLGLCDVKFEGLTAERCSLLSVEPEVVERVQQAVQQRRAKRPTKART